MSQTAVRNLGPATALTCRECGESYDLGPRYACEQCFGPLEVSYDFARVGRERIESGPRNIWRYRDLLPVPTTVAASDTAKVAAPDSSDKEKAVELPAGAGQ